MSKKLSAWRRLRAAVQSVTSREQQKREDNRGSGRFHAEIMEPRVLLSVTFAAKVDYATGIGPSSVTAADFNGDGKADLAVANANSGTVSVLLNNTQLPSTNSMATERFDNIQE